MLRSRPRRIFALIALVLIAAPLVASAALFDPDEGLHAAIAQEMDLRGDYVTPTFLGEPFLDKPILFFWTEAASLRLFGMDEDAVRVPPLLFGLLSMVGVAALGGALFGETAGVVAGICYATMMLPLGIGEIAVHDVALVPFICGACLALVKIDANGRVWLWSALAGVCLGLSILTKGLVGLAFVGLFALCLSGRRPAGAVRILSALAGATVLAAAIAAPWYVAMEHAHPGYLHYYFVDRHLRGYLTSTQLHAGRPWWYYGPILVGATLPWTGYAARAARDARRTPMLPVVWGWFVAGLVFLSVAQSKLGVYALPLFIPLALAVGEYIDRVLAPSDFRLRRPDGTRDRVFGRLFGLHAAILAALPGLGLLAVSMHFRARPDEWLWIVVVAAAVLVAVAATRAWRSQVRYAALEAYGWMTAIAIVGLAGFVAPHAATWMTGRDLARALNASGQLPSHVLVMDERIGSVIFYLSPPLRVQAAPARFANVSPAQAVDAMRRGPSDTIIAVRDDELDRFARLFSVPPPVHARAGTFTVYRVGDLRGALAQ